MQCVTCQNPSFEVTYKCLFPACPALLLLRELEESATEKKCGRCGLILEAIHKLGIGSGRIRCVESPEQYVVGINQGILSTSTEPPQGLTVLVSLENMWNFSGDVYSFLNLKQDVDVIKFDLYTECEDMEKQWKIPRTQSIPLCPNLYDDAVQARKWLDHCLNHHQELCPPIRQVLPTRVIDVGNSQQNPKLYKSLPDQEGTYCALSYCWGTDRTFITTQSTFQDRKQGFDIDDLPRTIRDAVCLTRSLNIRYLWVDSLCIIQDSPDDWERESARMSSVYSRATLTIVAVDSPGSDTGLILSGAGRRLLRLEWGDGKVFARTHPHNSWYSDLPGRSERFWDPFPTKSAGRETAGGGILGVINTRAWCLQELVLSARVLWMRAREISWSCVNSFACECEPVPVQHVRLFEENRWSESLRQFERVIRGIRALERLDSSRWQWATFWGHLVREYTRRDLTNTTDRLPAISGLAAQLQSYIRAQYVYGLWKTEDFLVQLLWENISYQAVQDAELETTYAPSWSWAGCHGEIRMSNPPATKLVWTLESISIQLRTLNSYGPGTGSIVLHTLIAPISFRNPSETNRRVGHFVYAGSNHDSDKPLILVNARAEISSRWLEDRRLHNLSSLSTPGSRKLELYFLFATVCAKREIGVDGPTGNFTGLVVEKFIDNDCEDGKISYRRLGIANDYFGLSDLDNDPFEVKEGNDANAGNYVERQHTRGSWELWKKLGKWESVRLV